MCDAATIVGLILSPFLPLPLPLRRIIHAACFAFAFFFLRVNYSTVNGFQSQNVNN